jgi:hypothetical protein
MNKSYLKDNIDWLIYADYLDDQNINHFIREDLQKEEIPWDYEYRTISFVGVSGFGSVGGGGVGFAGVGVGGFAVVGVVGGVGVLDGAEGGVGGGFGE